MNWSDNDIYNLLVDALYNPWLPSPVIAGSVHLDDYDSLWNTSWALWALDEYGIFPNHAYTVWAVWTDENDNSWVKLRDPYGYGSLTLWEDDGFVTMPFDHFVFIFTELGYAKWLDGPGGESGFDGMLDGATPPGGASPGAPVVTVGPALLVETPSDLVATPSAKASLGGLVSQDPSKRSFAPPAFDLLMVGSSANAPENIALSLLIGTATQPPSQMTATTNESTSSTEFRTPPTSGPVCFSVEADNLDDRLTKYTVDLLGFQLPGWERAL